MLTTDNYECTWDLFKSIPSLTSPGKTVFDETIEFNQQNKPHSQARLVDRNRAKIDVESMGFSMQDRIELLKLTEADEVKLGDSCITDWLSPSFFQTNFWYMCMHSIPIELAISCLYQWLNALVQTSCRNYAGT